MLFFNGKKCAVYVGSVMVPAGEVRDIPTHLHPDHKSAAKQENSETVKSDPRVDELLALTVPEIESQLGALTRKELDALWLAEENAEKPRRGVIDAIDAAILVLVTSENNK